MRKTSLVVLIAAALFAAGCYTKAYQEAVRNYQLQQNQAHANQAASLAASQAADQATSQAAKQPTNQATSQAAANDAADQAVREPAPEDNR